VAGVLHSPGESLAGETNSALNTTGRYRKFGRIAARWRDALTYGLNVRNRGRAVMPDAECCTQLLSFEQVRPANGGISGSLFGCRY